jgi:transposase
MTISQDLRIRIVKKVLSGMSCRRAAARFDVSPSSAIRFVQQHAADGTVAVKPRPPRKRRLDPWGEDILAWIKETPDITLEELSARLHEVHQVKAPTSTIDDWLRARNISFKKNRTRQ